MQISRIDKQNTGLFSKQQIDLSYNQQQLIPFISRPFSLESFEETMEKKTDSFSPETRKVLCNELASQYDDIDEKTATLANIEKLRLSNSFTVTTGHQLVSFTGPLYFIYKILHVIKQTEELNEQYPEYNFIPVYWMATEDHDFEEIQSFNLFGKQISWETNQTGAVGRFHLENFDSVKAEFADFFKNNPESEIFSLLENLTGENYAQTFRKLVHSLFGKFGLVIIDGDSKGLKEIFQPIIEKELNTQFSYTEVQKTIAELEDFGYKIQVNPREINLFYVKGNLRERIVPTPNGFEINTIGTFSKNELIELSRTNPEEFSPNVVLRPLYQEMILPNLNYVGGAGEINYWLELKRVFESANIPFPLIQVRNSLIWIDSNTQEKMKLLNYTISDIFIETELLKKRFVEANSEDEIDFTEIENELKQLQHAMIEKTKQTDVNLEKFAIAETVRLEKQVSSFTEKLYKSSKSKHDKSLKSIEQIKQKLFPNGGMQERSLNFFNLVPTGDYSELIELLKNNMIPFSGDLIIVSE